MQNVDLAETLIQIVHSGGYFDMKFIWSHSTSELMWKQSTSERMQLWMIHVVKASRTIWHLCHFLELEQACIIAEIWKVYHKGCCKHSLQCTIVPWCVSQLPIKLSLNVGGVLLHPFIRFFSGSIESQWRYPN